MMVQTALMNDYAQAQIDQNALEQMTQAAVQIAHALGFGPASKVAAQGITRPDEHYPIIVLLSERCGGGGGCWQ